MALKTRPIQATFNGGEISPHTGGRIDIDRWRSSLAQAWNMIVLPEGGVTRRPGTRFVAPIKEINARILTEDGDYLLFEDDDYAIVEDDSTISTRPTFLFPFVFSDTQAYVLEIGDEYIRFFMNDGQLYDESALQYVTTESGDRITDEVGDYILFEDLDPNAQPYELAAPWPATSLRKLQGAQTLDVMYFAHPDVAPRILTRTGHTNWALSVFEPSNGPFLPLNDSAITITPSAVTGSVTLTASTDLFDAGHVGALWRIEDKDQANYDTWEPAKSVTANDVVWYNDNVYLAVNTGTTGAVAPVHVEGDRADGITGVKWRYLHSGFGIVKITAVASATSATATVLSLLPGTGATAKWREGAWSDYRGWPVAVTLFEQRLWWARGQTLWSSVAGDFSDYSIGTLPDDAITATIVSKTANPIEILAEGPVLAALTRAREWVMQTPEGEAASADVNFRLRAYSSEGAAKVPPVMIDNAIVFVGRSGQRLLQMSYDFQSDGYRPVELSVLARHMLRPGA